MHAEDRLSLSPVFWLTNYCGRPAGLFNREHIVWKCCYINLVNGMRFPVTDYDKNEAVILRIKDRMKVVGDRGSLTQPIVKETVFTKEVVLIQCRSCGAHYQQGTLRCLTCGANQVLVLS